MRLASPGAGSDVGQLRRVAYLSLQTPCEGRATYTHVHEIVRGLRDLGYVVKLYAPSCAERGRRRRLPARVLAFVTLQIRLLRHLQCHDALYVRAHPAALPAALIARLAKRMVVHEVNGPYADAYINNPRLRALARLLAAVQRWQYRHANGLICVTEGLADWLRGEAPAVPSSVIPNGANVELFSPDRERWPGLDGNYVVFFGGLNAWHGVDWMLNAATSPLWPDGIALVVVGEGPGGAAVQAAAAAYPARVRRLGQLPYEEVGRVVAHARASLIPIVDCEDRSAAGLAPIKLFETLACGVPAIVSDLPGLSALVRKHGLGRVVPEGDVEALAAAVHDACAGDGLSTALRARARALAVREFSWSTRAEQIVAFLTNLETSQG